MTPQVRRELDALLRYAQAITPTDAGRCYLGGALTMLLHLRLLTDDEYREWWDRLMAQLPRR